MKTIKALMLIMGSGLAACTAPASRAPVETLQQQVQQRERSFAASMQQRDFAAFAEHLSDEAVFVSGEHALRGRAAVSQGWQRYFQTPEAPFSWAPDQVEVLDSGTLALSSGPVYAPDGQLIGRFNSIWRQDAPGVWHIVFDKGSPVCPVPAP
jgi:ketosteroid isomerase-like protein